MAYKNELILRLQLGDGVITIGGPSSPYRLLASGLSGMEAPETVVQTAEHAHLDGASVISRHVTGREMTVSFEIADHQNREAHRAALLAFFDPVADGTLTVTRSTDGNSTTRTAACILSGMPTFTQEHLHAHIRVRVPLYCPDPYFYSETITVTNGGRIVPLFAFPATVTETVGLTGGVHVTEDTVTVYNTGDAPTGFCLRLTAADAGGNAGTKNVCITRAEDGAYIRIPLTLACGDTLTVSTLPGAKYILHNGVICMKFDRGSTFFSLLRGKNTLRITADAALTVPDVRLQFRCRHFGV